ncbi:SusC/RagA family TonB-linked outer membrane protein [Zobellia nedashkovskayae]
MKYKSINCFLFGFFLMQFVWAQDTVITGTITDEIGTPLPGVNIIETGTSNGVVSDFDGNYSIMVATGASLNFSYISYVTQLVKIDGNVVVNIQMQPDLETLDEVVVVGYSSEKKENIVSAVVTVKGGDLVETGVTNISQIIQDRLPGVITELGSGQPGADDVNIVIRGASSFKGGANSPLVLIDGIETASGFSQIDPGEIASFSVLKDAASTAVYGVRGANGVILITTKRGRIGSPKISVDVGTTVKTVSSTPNQLGSYDVLQLGNEAIRNTGRYDLYNNQSYINEFRYGDRDFIRYPEVDWYDVLIKDVGWESNARINISGGTESVQYFSSFSANKVGDILNNAGFNGYYNPEFSFNRYNFRTNLDFKITNSTKIAVNIGGRSELKRSPESEFSGDGTSRSDFSFYRLSYSVFFPGYLSGRICSGKSR